MSKPNFIDNRDGNTLLRALEAVLSGGATSGMLRARSEPTPTEVRIASAYVTLGGLNQVAGRLASVPTVRLMLGADLSAGALGRRRRLGESEDEFRKRQLQAELDDGDDTLRHERDRMPFSKESDGSLRGVAGALRAGNLEVRRYKKDFLHAKAYIFTSEGGDGGVNTEGSIYRGSSGLIAGSSNLTVAGLEKNLELNLGRYDRPTFEQARRWFDELWEDAEPYDEDLIKLLFGTVPDEEWKPWQIFLRVLWQLYGDEVEEDERIVKNLPLAEFQKHGVARALRLIRDIGGAIVADEVGLGKTFIAGEILQRYHERRQRALLICPASLRDSTWRKFRSEHQVFVECVSFEQLARDGRLQRDSDADEASLQEADEQGESEGGERSGSRMREVLERPLDEYQLVVVDEAHNYRNPDAPSRAGVLRRLLWGEKRRDLLMLTATPVNNSLWDLYHLVRFFVRQDARFVDRGILSIRKRFEDAMREDPSNLSPDMLYPIIDATTVKRTRQFVKKHYSGDQITGPDGSPLPIVFPQANAITVRYNLDDLLPNFFDRLEAALNPDDEEENAIRFARYMPDAWRRADTGEGADGEEGVEESARTQAMVGLLRSGLLKRFESSAFAFRKTVEKMVREHDTFLKALDEGYVVTTAFMRELSADDEDVFEDALAGTEHRTEASLYESEELREAVQRDRDLLQELVEQVNTVVETPEKDPKLRALVDELIEIARQADDEAALEDEARQKRKVLVFSFFEDTVRWIRDFLKEEFERREELNMYRGRMAAVSGSGELDQEASRQKAVEGFAPVSMQAVDPVDRFDLLISTDVLAEGVNLQQCRHIINFDVPWNPMRLVQRHGRIDRIGSTHDRVYMRTIFPVDRLDQLLNLEQRILNKLAMASASVGVVAPVEGAARGTQVFSETREEIEKLRYEDASLFERGGTAAAAQTGEEYRQTLRRALRGMMGAVGTKWLETMPWKAGSGMEKVGARRGIFFCGVVGGGARGIVSDGGEDAGDDGDGTEGGFAARIYLRFVEVDEDWQVSSADDPIVREMGTCLRMIECEPDTPPWFPDWLRDRAYELWKVAQEDILEDWMQQTDPANLQPKVRPLNHRVAEFIRENEPEGEAQEKQQRALDILEAPWPRREEILLREWFNEADAGASGRRRGRGSGNGRKQSPAQRQVHAKHLINRILGTGLEPAKSPPLLPPIDLDDVELLCWMGIEPVAEGKVAWINES